MIINCVLLSRFLLYYGNWLYKSPRTKPTSCKNVLFIQSTINCSIQSTAVLSTGFRAQYRQKANHAAGRSRQGGSQMKNTHVLQIWKGHTVDTSPHVRGPASVRLSLAPCCSCPLHSTHTKTKTLYLNVLTLQYIFDHGQQATEELWNWLYGTWY